MTGAIFTFIICYNTASFNECAFYSQIIYIITFYIITAMPMTIEMDSHIALRASSPCLILAANASPTGKHGMLECQHHLYIDFTSP